MHEIGAPGADQAQDSEKGAAQRANLSGLIDDEDLDIMSAQHAVEITAGAAESDIVSEIGLRAGEIHRRMHIAVQPAGMVENVKNAHG
ncbi:hypothetical protein K32_10520 [Kaistia sp. 32K]|nr:hypothetical protein K32_10520 [Kaistia sp. 32K]